MSSSSSAIRSAIVLFTRDLRVHDHPALAAAVREADRVLPLFVLDDAILRSDFATPNRLGFLRDALADLNSSLERRGSGLFVRRGDLVGEVIRVARDAKADAIFLAADVSAYAQRREHHLAQEADRERLELRLFPGVTTIAPDDVTTSDGTHFTVFTPYHRRWREVPRRPVENAPRRITSPKGVARGRLPSLEALAHRTRSPRLPVGGETAARKRLATWTRSGLERYEELHDDLAADATSRLSPYLHFGCLSPLEVVERVQATPGAEAFIRQLCWRDFYHQLLAARPETASEDMRPRDDRWRKDEHALGAWKNGLTGYPIVDAGMRQLQSEGFIHNRARLVTASFLTKQLYLDWRVGARHYFDLLVDGDVANNVGNWQWVAGTGADTRPNRIFNPTRQAQRFDPSGDYVRRYVPELADVEGPSVHEPWSLGLLRPPDYPAPIVDHGEAIRRFRARRRHSAAGDGSAP